jgi:hypothetical protein
MKRNDTESLALDLDRRLAWLRIVTAIALVSGFVLSWRLWISSRLFPFSPVISSLPAIPFPFDYIWFVGLIGLLVAIAVAVQPGRLVMVFLVSAGLLSLFDQMRWQPWFYQYFFLLAGLGICAWKKAAAKTNRTALNSSALIIVSTYFWSGVQKLNATFLSQTWPILSKPALRFFALGRGLPISFGLSIPLLEIGMGLGLMTRRFRKAAVITAVVSHAVILGLLVSSGENTVVWPWNIAMGCFVVILFWQNKESSIRRIVRPRHPFHILVLILFGILPALSFVGAWDSYLSSALYSGNDYQAAVYVDPSVMAQLPVSLHQYVWQGDPPMFLDINRWAYGELNVPVYPEPRVFRRATERLCEYAGNSGDVKLAISDQPDLLTGRRESQYYDCNHLR